MSPGVVEADVADAVEAVVEGDEQERDVDRDEPRVLEEAALDDFEREAGGMRTSAVKCSTQKCMMSSTSRAAPVMRCKYQLMARPDINLSRNGLTQRQRRRKRIPN